MCERMITVTDQILKLDNQLCFRLYSVSRKMTKAYAPFLEKYNLTYPQYIVLLVLFEHKEMDFKQLSDVVELKTGTLTPILQNLEKTGYIKRIQNPEDKRKVTIQLSEEGNNLHKNIVSVPLGLHDKLQVSLDMYETLVKELDELSDMLDKTLEQ